MFVSIAKLAAHQTIALLVARETSNLIVDHTEVDPESITLKVGTMCVGEYVAGRARPYTDKAIDKAAAWVAEKRNKKESTIVPE